MWCLRIVVISAALVWLLVGCSSPSSDHSSPSSPSGHPAVPSDLEQKTFSFEDGVAFGRPGTAVRLMFRAFTGNTGFFSLASGGFAANGSVTIASCDFDVVSSTFPVGQGPQGHDRMLINPCQVEAGSGRLTAINAVSGASSVSGSPTPTPPNTPPVANAGAAQTVLTGVVVTLDGRGSSDADNDPLTYRWTLTSKPQGSTAALSGATTAQPTFTADIPGAYVLMVVVNDGKVDSPTATVTITATRSNTPPVANAGLTQTLTLPAGATTMAVTLDGRGSSDPDGTVVGFQWTGTPDPADVAQPTVTLGVGTFTFTLVVTDNAGATSTPSTVTITVKAANQPPVANAGPAQTVTLPAGATTTTVTLDGRGSSDPDGAVVGFQWTGTPDPADVAQPTVTLGAGTFTFTLVVTDNAGATSAPSTVTITVRPAANQPPVANAGAAQTVLTGAVVTLDGRGSSDADNDPLTYRWTLTSKPQGSTAALSGATTAQPTFTADIQGAYVLTVVVNDGKVDSAVATVMITAQGPGPSIVSINGRQLMVQQRHADRTLAPATPYIIRGVDWSPASTETTTSNTDPHNAAVRRPEFGKWAAIDIPLMATMHVNTVRLFLDPGFDQTLGPIGLAVLDALYHEGIMVILTVDDAINDLQRVQQAVTFYKDHPAILMWILGSEWNLNLYFGVASSLQDAARRTQTAAALIKTLDANHPVATSYGEIDINANGLRLADTQTYVNTICPGVDIWGLNIYRGRTFGTLFTDWASITTKPMFLGEFGTDAFRTTNPPPPPQGAVDEAMQAQWDLSLWNNLLRNVSANDPSKVALGGTVFEWNDEWWKVQPAGSQQTDGFVLLDGHPDGFANEEYFGIVTINRQTRQLYDTLKTAFDPTYQPPPATMALQAVSRGALVPNSSLGFAEFRKDGTPFYHKDGGAGGGRGLNIAAMNPETGALLQPVQNFDTWGTRTTGTAMNAMITFLNGLPNGTVVLVAVGDEAGLNTDNSCTHLSFTWVEAGLRALEALGSTQLRNYCFRYSWAMVSVKGESRARGEQLGNAVEVSVQTTLSLP